MVVSGNKGQIHPIYNLVHRNQPLEFHGVEIDKTSTEDWLEVVEEVMELFEIIDHEKI